MATLLSYTRLPIDNILYDPKLAYSMHLGVIENGKLTALNHNSGVLFALATENEDGSINAMSIKKPFVFKKDNGEYGIVAIRVLGDGDADESSKGMVLTFSTKDFVRYEETGLVKLSDDYIESVACQYVDGECQYSFVDVNGKSEGEDILKLAGLDKLYNVGLDAEGIVPVNMLEVPDEIVDYLKKKLLTPVNTRIELPKEVIIKPGQTVKDAVKNICATAYYSDGSTVSKKIDWNLDEVIGEDGAVIAAEVNPEATDVFDLDAATYTLRGRVHKDHFEFPVAFNRADPCVAKWNGKYYFIATNDADYNHTLYIREADNITDLVNAKEHLILDSETYEGIGGLLWAPEFHVVNGKMYIFHACTPGEFFFEESHIMELREGGDPTNKDDWSKPRRITRADGSDICEAGKEITLDMTCFEWEGEYYVVWSQRQFLPKDLGAWLYIAKLNPDEPWKLATDPIVLSKPAYGWANNHTFVDEGPFALLRDDKLYLTFSAAAVDTSYVVGLFTIEKGKDLLDIKNWRKTNYPILTSRSVKGEFGTGHNAYAIDDDGTVWNTYHARPGVDGVRSSGIRRVHFDFEGEPRLDVTEEFDVLEGLMDVSILLKVEK